MSRFYEIIEARTRSGRNGEALDTCNTCHRKMGPGDVFVVCKAYDRGNGVLEAVQCFDCQGETRDYVSEQSMENLMLYGGRRVNEFLEDPQRRELYHLEEPSCLITGEELLTSDSFELYTFFMPGAGDSENYILIGPTAIEQMSELLSEETRKSWERFTESLAPDSPERVISPMFF